MIFMHLWGEKLTFFFLKWGDFNSKQIFIAMCQLAGKKREEKTMKKPIKDLINGHKSTWNLRWNEWREEYREEKKMRENII